jgi:hypothetical protein
MDALAEQDARMQALLWLGGGFAGKLADDTVDSLVSFEATLQFSSKVDQQALPLRQDHSVMRWEADHSYHYYGLYSLSRDAVPEHVPIYPLFTYYAKSVGTPAEGTVSVSADFNGTRYDRDTFPALPPVNAAALEVPEWLNDWPPDDVLWAIGTAQARSLVVQNLAAQVRSVAIIARQINGSVMQTELGVAVETFTMYTPGTRKLWDTVTADGTTWQLWEWSKANVHWAFNARPDLFSTEIYRAKTEAEIAAEVFDREAEAYAEFKTDEALRLMEEQLNNSER